MIFNSTQQANGNKTNVTLDTIDFPVKNHINHNKFICETE